MMNTLKTSAMFRSEELCSRGNRGRPSLCRCVGTHRHRSRDPLLGEESYVPIGYPGAPAQIGDDETPADMPDILVFSEGDEGDDNDDASSTSGDTGSSSDASSTTLSG